jgi:hypothetical protein
MGLKLQRLAHLRGLGGGEDGHASTPGVLPQDRHPVPMAQQSPDL